MSTSAHALYELFVRVTNDSPPGQKFPEAVADKLDLYGGDRDGLAMSFVQKLLKTALLDIEELPFDELRKRELRSRIGKFSGYLDFSHCHLDVENSKRNQLTAENLIGLTMVDMALSGKREIATLSREVVSLANEFRDLREDVGKCNIPDDLRESIIRRLNQIAAALDHFAFFGRRGFEDAMFALTGEIALNSRVIKEASPSWAKKLAGLLTRSAEGVATAHTAAKGIQGTIDAGSEIYEKISGLLGQ